VAEERAHNRLGIAALAASAALAALALPVRRADPSPSVALTHRAPPDALVGLLDAGPGTDDGWLRSLARAAGSTEALVRALAALQPGAREEVGHGAGWGPRQRSALLAALGRERGSALSGALAATAREGRATALAALEAFGEHGRAQDLGTVGVALETVRRRPARLSPSEARAAGRALARFLEREPGHRGALLEGLEGLGEDALPCLCRALAAEPARRHEAFELAASVLGERAYRRPREALEVIAVTAASASRLAQRSAAELTRPFLTHAAAEVALAAVAASEALADVDACPALTVALDAGDATLQDAAHRALVALSGRDHGRDATRWGAWIAQERAWLGAARQLLGVLTRGTPERALAALRELEQRTLFVSERAALAAEALVHPSAEVRLAALGALAPLVSEGSLAPLTARIADDQDARVRAAAREVLAGAR